MLLTIMFVDYFPHTAQLLCKRYILLNVQCAFLAGLLMHDALFNVHTADTGSYYINRNGRIWCLRRDKHPMKSSGNPFFLDLNLTKKQSIRLVSLILARLRTSRSLVFGNCLSSVR